MNRADRIHVQIRSIIQFNSTELHVREATNRHEIKSEHQQTKHSGLWCHHASQASVWSSEHPQLHPQPPARPTALCMCAHTSVCAHASVCLCASVCACVCGCVCGCACHVQSVLSPPPDSRKNMEGRGSEEVNMETSTHKGVCVQVEEQEVNGGLEAGGCR